MSNFNIGNFLVLYIIISRVFELILSYINTKNLIQKGAKECYREHYKFIVMFHLIFVFYFLYKSLHITNLNLYFFYLFILLQFIRYKVIFDLGKYWTTRIIVLESVPLLKNGMYKYFKHPNYFVVLLEIFFVCIIFQDISAMVVFLSIKIILLKIRISCENKANKNRIKI